LIRAFVLDDEPLAVKRLVRLLGETGRVEIAGTSSDPEEALAWLRANSFDLLFLDIEMPGMNGFELLSKLGTQQPLVVFTTAYSQYALQAFQVNSIDYLLKPIEREQLERTLHKIERIRGGAEQAPDLARMLAQLQSALGQTPAKPQYPERLPSRIGEKIQFVELRQVTHFYASDKLTYAATPAKSYVVDSTIAELEQKLDPQKFLRVHRSTMVNMDYVSELHPFFTGRYILVLKDGKNTQVTVSRDRVKELKDRLGL
jgi:two-component system LytT family response regulator